MAAMEKLERIQQTLSEIDGRVPDAFRVALGLGYRASPVPAPGEDDGVAEFAEFLLQPPPPTAAEGGDDGPDAAAAPALRMEWGSCYLPLHDHDAHFGHAGAGVLGVADGVGEYAALGVDAGAFSRGLMESAAAEVAARGGSAAGGAGAPAAAICPYALLERAYEETAASGAPGASTALVLSLDAGGALAWAYIGDSGFAVLRAGGRETAFLSTPQRHLSRTSRTKIRCAARARAAASPARRRRQHLFASDGAPFQLGADRERSDRVADAAVGRVGVRAGDVVVAGTDGLFENLLDEQLERAVRMGTRLGLTPKQMADVVAGVAYERSKQPSSKKLRKGNPDDITVLVAFLFETADS